VRKSDNGIPDYCIDDKMQFNIHKHGYKSELKLIQFPISTSYNVVADFLLYTVITYYFSRTFNIFFLQLSNNYQVELLEVM